MAELRIKIDGVPELRIDLKAVIDELNDMKVMQSIAEEGASLVRAFAPVDTGRLVGTTRASKSKNKAVVRIGNRSVVYAGVQNWGWPARNITGQQFLARADQALKPHIEPMIEEAIKRIIRARGLQ